MLPKLDSLLLSLAVLAIAGLALWALGRTVLDLVHAVAAGLAVAGG